MSTPTSIKSHPIHPMLIVFPIGLLIFSFISQIIQFRTGSAAWEATATYTLAGGIIGALLAAIPGFVDFLSIPESEARDVGIKHAAINLTVVVIMAIAFYLRLRNPAAALPFWLTCLGVVGLFIGGWLGGSLVYVHGVGVEFKGKEERMQRKEQEKNKRPESLRPAA